METQDGAHESLGVRGSEGSDGMYDHEQVELPKARGASEATERSDLVSVLLRDGAVTEAQVRHARRVSAKLGGTRPLVPLLLDLGLVTAERFRAALRTHRLELRIGALLVELGHLREVDVAAALRVQEESAAGDRKLGEILVEQGLVGAQELATVLSSQLGIPCVEAGAIEPDTELLELAPLDVCRRHRFLPLRREDGRVCVAFADPLDKEDAAAAQASFGPALAPWIASSNAIDEAIARLALAARVSTDTEAGEREAVTTLHEILAGAMRTRASEIHFEPGSRRLTVRARREGVLSVLRELPPEMSEPLLRRIAFDARVAEERGAPHRAGRLGFEYEGRTIELEAAFLATARGETATLRIRDPQRRLMALDDLGLLPSMRRRLVERALMAPGEALLVAGPAASGRTTTFHACVAAVSEPGARVIVLEERVDVPIPGASHVLLPAEPEGLRTDVVGGALRQLPDVLALGASRGDTALEALWCVRRSGPRLLVVVEADDAVSALERAVRVRRDTPHAFIGALAQRLVRRTCLDCARPFVPNAAQVRALGASVDAVASAGFRHGRGCSHCQETGYAGRIGLFELVVLDEDGDACLRRGEGLAAVRRSALRSGAMTLLEDGLVKAARGLTTIEELLRVAPRSVPPRPLTELERLAEQEC